MATIRLTAEHEHAGVTHLGEFPSLEAAAAEVDRLERRYEAGEPDGWPEGAYPVAHDDAADLSYEWDGVTDGWIIVGSNH